MRVCGRDWLDSVVFVGNGEVSDCKCRRAFVFCTKCVIQVVLPLHLVLFVVVVCLCVLCAAIVACCLLVARTCFGLCLAGRQVDCVGQFRPDRARVGRGHREGDAKAERPFWWGDISGLFSGTGMCRLRLPALRAWWCAAERGMCVCAALAGGFVCACV